MEVLLDIPVVLNLEVLKKRLHMKKSTLWPGVRDLAETIQPLLKAKGVYEACAIEARLEKGVRANGVELTSRILRHNLKEAQLLFPYVLTLGPELEERISSCPDPLEQYYLDTIGNVALANVREDLEARLRAEYKVKQLSFMSPGSLTDWPLEEQGPLFSLLGDVESAIGVRLNQSLVMSPRKSISGVYFPSQVPFLSCRLCPRRSCESRKAPYNEELALSYPGEAD